MFTLTVLKRFRKTLGSWLAATPQQRKPRPTFKPRLEALEERWCPASLYWDPTNGNNANTPGNWDVGSLGSGNHPAMAPGNTPGVLDYIYFDGSAGNNAATGINYNGNQNSTWNYMPGSGLGSVAFQNGWNQILSTTAGNGFSVTVGSMVNNAQPQLAPSGGASATAAITLTQGANFSVATAGSLTLKGGSNGGAIFFAGDGSPGEVFRDNGTVTYLGTSGQTDYLKVPVLVSSGSFTVNTATLQVSGKDDQTQSVSFYQDTTSSNQTNIAAGGTLWAYINFQMNGGALQTTDTNTSDSLEVGTSSADGTAFIIGGTVNIAYNTGSYGKLTIKGTTSTNNPTVDVGTATLAFKVDAFNSTNRDQLWIGKGDGTNGRIVFDYNGGTTTVGTLPQGDLSKQTNKISWQLIFFGSRVNAPQINPATKYWSLSWVSNPVGGNTNVLQINYDPNAPC